MEVVEGVLVCTAACHEYGHVGHLWVYTKFLRDGAVLQLGGGGGCKTSDTKRYRIYVVQKSKKYGQWNCKVCLVILQLASVYSTMK